MQRYMELLLTQVLLWDIWNNVILLDDDNDGHWVYGMGLNFEDGSATHDIYHNTIKIYGTANTLDKWSHCIYIDDIAGTLNIKNNVFHGNTRTMTGSRGILVLRFIDNTLTLNSDYNWFEISNTSRIARWSTTAYSLADWCSNRSEDCNSQSGSITIDTEGYVTTPSWAGQDAGTDLTISVPQDKMMKQEMLHLG